MRRSPAEKEILQKVQKEDLDLAEYAHREVDRFAVLLDLWTCEQNFLFNKRKVIALVKFKFDEKRCRRSGNKVVVTFSMNKPKCRNATTWNLNLCNYAIVHFDNSCTRKSKHQWLANAYTILENTWPICGQIQISHFRGSNNRCSNWLVDVADA